MKKGISAQEKLEKYLYLKKGYFLRNRNNLLQKSVLATVFPVLAVSGVNAQCQGAQTTNFAFTGSGGVGLMIDIDVDGDGNDDFRIEDPGAPNLRTLWVKPLNGGGIQGLTNGGGQGTAIRYTGGVINGNNVGTSAGAWWLVYQTGGAMAGAWRPPYPKSGFFGIKQGGIYGWGFPAFKGGVIQYISDYGKDAFIEKCEVLKKLHGPRFTVPSLLRKLEI